MRHSHRSTIRSRTSKTVSVPTAKLRLTESTAIGLAKQRPYAPETTSNFGLDYTRGLSNGLVFDANLNVDTSSEYFITANLDKNIDEGGYTKLGAQIGLGSEDGKWRVSIIGDNLTDERIKVIGGTIPLARTFVRLASGGALDGIAYDAIYARPRNIAIKLDYTF